MEGGNSINHLSITIMKNMSKEEALDFIKWAMENDSITINVIGSGYNHTIKCDKGKVIDTL